MIHSFPTRCSSDLDRAAGPALSTSFANGAQLSYVYTDALGSPALWKHLPQLLMGLDTVFRMHWLFDPDSLKWGLAFLRNTRSVEHTSELQSLMRISYAVFCLKK